MHLLRSESTHFELVVAGIDLLGRERQPGARLQSQGEQKAHGLFQPAGGKDDRASGRAIEPLQVIDRHEYRLRTSERTQNAEEAEGDRALVDGPRCGLLEE